MQHTRHITSKKDLPKQEQQLIFFGKVARCPPECPVRQLVFERDLSKKTFGLERRRGRPNLEWNAELFKIVEGIFPSVGEFRATVANESDWRRYVRSSCRAKPPTS